MADKEIIIDGVDVTECQNYNRRTEKCKIPCWINNIKCTGLNCSDIKDCYFKQLKQAEQELADLKEFCEKLKKSNSNYATAVFKRNFKLDKIKEYRSDFYIN